MKRLDLAEKAVLLILLTGVPTALYWRVHDPNIFKEFLFKACVSTLFLIYMIKVIQARKVNIPQNYLSYGVILFFVLSGLSWLYSQYSVVGAARFEPLVYFVLLFFLISQQTTHHETARFGLEALSLGAFLVSGYGILQYFGIELYPIQRHFTRISATLGHPNFLGGYLVGVLPLTTGLLLSSRKSYKSYLYALFLAGQAVCLLLTLSRASWISAFVSFVFFGVIVLMHGKNRLPFRLDMKKWGFICLMVFILIAMAISIKNRIPGDELSRLTALTERSPQNTFWARWLMWQGTARLIMERPIVGNGIGTFSILFPSYQPPQLASLSLEVDAVLRHAHNEYLEVWAETGILGLTAFVLIIGAAIIIGINLIKSYKNDDYDYFMMIGITSGLVGIIFNIFFCVNFRFFIVPIVFWFYLGAINGLSQECTKCNIEFRLFGKQKLLVMLSFLLLLFFFYVSLDKTASHLIAERYFYRGLAHYASGRLQEALQDVQLAVDRCKTEPKIYYKKGAMETRLGKWPDALATYNALQEIHPDFFHLNFNLSLCYLSIGDIENAIRHGKRQIELYPGSTEQYYLLGKAYYLNKNYSEAEIYLNDYVSRKPNNARALGYLGNIFASRSEWERAIVQYERALAMNPNDLNTRLNICQSYLNTGDFDKLCLQLAAIFQGGPETSVVRQHHKTIESIVKKLESECDKAHLTRICPAINEYLNSSDQ